MEKYAKIAHTSFNTIIGEREVSMSRYIAGIVPIPASSIGNQQRLLVNTF